MRFEPVFLSQSFTSSEALSFLAESVNRHLLKDSSDYFVFLDETQKIDTHALTLSLKEKSSIDVWYDPRLLVRSAQPHLIDYVAPTNYFNLSFDNGGPLWSISFRGLIVSRRTIQDRGFLDSRFTTLEGASAEWVYRMVMSGVFFRPLHFLREHSEVTVPAYSLEDELRLIHYRFGLKWFLWCLGRVALTRPGALMQVISRTPGIYSSTGLPIGRNLMVRWRDGLLPSDADQVTVIIPTIDRYPYLEKVLQDLELQTIKPREVIIIDQTTPVRRKKDWPERYSAFPVKYLELDQAGQCRSRNLGLLSSEGNYLLFVDDDVEFGAHLIEDHLKNLHYFQADVSCGVCDEAGAGPIPKEFTFLRMSDVFPTNNGMVRRSILETSGLFDLAYDKGQRADGDLGARIYKQGALMVLNPEIRLFHHHAPMGGLRTHKARKITFASSRSLIRHFRLPHRTELYLNMRYFSKVQQRESIILHLLGTFSIRGGWLKKLAKILFAFVSLPINLAKVLSRRHQASKMLARYPQIPIFPAHG